MLKKYQILVKNLLGYLPELNDFTNDYRVFMPEYLVKYNINISMSKFFQMFIETNINITDEIIKSFIKDVYLTNKIYKLKLSVELQDNISNIINESIDYNNIYRINSVFSICKYEYQNLTNLDEILKQYNITDKSQIVVCNKYYTIQKYYNMELEIAKKIRNLINTHEITEINLPKFNLLQNQAVNLILSNNLSIITGKPGTGKSEILGYFLDTTDCIILTPTGAASENLQTRFPKHINRIATIARFIHTIFKKKSNGFIIIDEFSMCDIPLFYKLLLFNINKLVLVGDHNQLPSIKLGQLLKDFIDSNKIPFIELKENYRNIRGILKVIDYVLINKKLAVYKNAVESIEYNIDKFCNQFGFEYLKTNITIISPTNHIVDEINNNLQKFNTNIKLNNRFKKNDKIMFLKNMPELDLYNGTILYLENLVTINKICIFTFKNISKSLKYTEFTCKESEINQFIKLAYASTVHKMQGKESDIIWLVLIEYPRIMWDVKLIYTAISRAKKMCYITANDYNMINESIKINKTRFTSIPNLL